ncbi:PspC domain-containing protein [Pedobacter sp. Du54]|uniref:PspC domain-containing protein n=1 Tax=Pedobacter anseongensis TaxID=3133439 RepID=UPI0030B484D3
MEKRLYRNEHDKVLSGVSSGLAEYLGYDVMLIRILFVASALFTLGATLVAYIILWIVIPVNNDPSARFAKFYHGRPTSPNDQLFNSPNAFSNPSNSGPQTKWNTENVGPNFTMPNQPDFTTAPQGNDTGRTIAGLVLILLGCFFLAKKFFFIPAWFSIFKLWPLVIVALGISLIFKNKRRNEWEQFKKETEEAQKSKTEHPVEAVVEPTGSADSNTPTA